MEHRGRMDVAGMRVARSTVVFSKVIPPVAMRQWSMMRPFGLIWAITSTQTSVAVLGGAVLKLVASNMLQSPGGNSMVA